MRIKWVLVEKAMTLRYAEQSPLLRGWHLVLKVLPLLTTSR